MQASDQYNAPTRSASTSTSTARSHGHEPSPLSSEERAAAAAQAAPAHDDDHHQQQQQEARVGEEPAFMGQATDINTPSTFGYVLSDVGYYTAPDTTDARPFDFHHSVPFSDSAALPSATTHATRAMNAPAAAVDFDSSSHSFYSAGASGGAFADDMSLRSTHDHISPVAASSLSPPLSAMSHAQSHLSVETYAPQPHPPPPIDYATTSLPSRQALDLHYSHPHLMGSTPGASSAASRSASPASEPRSTSATLPESGIPASSHTMDSRFFAQHHQLHHHPPQDFASSHPPSDHPAPPHPSQPHPLSYAHPPLPREIWSELPRAVEESYSTNSPYMYNSTPVFPSFPSTNAQFADAQPSHRVLFRPPANPLHHYSASPSADLHLSPSSLDGSSQFHPQRFVHDDAWVKHPTPNLQHGSNRVSTSASSNSWHPSMSGADQYRPYSIETSTSSLQVGTSSQPYRPSPSTGATLSPPLELRRAPSTSPPTHPSPKSRANTAARPRKLSPQTKDIVSRAAANRADHASLPPPLKGATGTTLSPMAADDSDRPHADANSSARTGSSASQKSQKTKPFCELAASCRQCGEPLAILFLRGGDIERPSPAPFTPRCSCLCVSCLEKGGPDESVGPTRLSKTRKLRDERSKGSEPPSTYEDTLSGAVDALHRGDGHDLDEGWRETRKPTPAPPPVKLPPELKAEGMSCDVCTIVVGIGSTTATIDDRPVLDFSVEVVCKRCLRLYQPCSDCGGGGGRLTPGRWRCKELFPGGRKTCLLSHHRQPNLDELSFETYRLRELAASDIDSLEARCRQLYFNSRLGVLARPEFLSHGDGLCLTFEQAEKTTIDQWNLLRPHFREDIEHSRGTVRYIALQYSMVRTRRAKARQKSQSEMTEEEQRSVTGYHLLELDLKHGVVFIAAAIPWATSGVAFDAHYHLGEHALRRVRSDLEQMNSSGAFPPNPALTQIFVVAPFKRDSRITMSIERRGYLPFDEHLRRYPQTSLEAFPPLREIFIPRAFVGAWQVYVLQLKSDDDHGGPPEVKIVRKRKSRTATRRGKE